MRPPKFTCTPTSKLPIWRSAAAIGADQVQAAFDPYIENRWLVILLDLQTLGVAVSDSFADADRNQNDAADKATSATHSVVLAGLDCTAPLEQLPARYNPYEGHQRRFMLLSAGKSLNMGGSLTSMKAIEKVSVVSDTKDLPLFDGEWNRAAPL